MKTQNDLILSHLERGGTITAKRAERWPFLCRRLAARVADLRAEGHDIQTEIIKGRCPRSGRIIRWARYKLLTTGEAK